MLWILAAAILLLLGGALIETGKKVGLFGRSRAADLHRAFGAAEGKRTSFDHTISVDGLERQYLVHLPAGYSPTWPMPVVLNFHGGGGNAEWQQRETGMNATADTGGFVVVYPQGTSGPFGLGTWNAGSCCGLAMRRNVDDVKFTAALLDDLASKHPVDKRRIFATGMSNGAMLVYRLACELSDRIAAVAPVAGALLDAGHCEPRRPIPVLHFHGTADKLVPFEGGYGKIGSSGEFRSVVETISKFVQFNECSKEPEKAYDKGDATCQSFRSCKNSADVNLCTIDGGGHTWPGAKPNDKRGKTSYNISANDAMWDFFRSHPMP